MSQVKQEAKQEAKDVVIEDDVSEDLSDAGSDSIDEVEAAINNFNAAAGAGYYNSVHNMKMQVMQLLESNAEKMNLMVYGKTPTIDLPLEPLIVVNFNDKIRLAALQRAVDELRPKLRQPFRYFTMKITQVGNMSPTSVLRLTFEQCDC